jgi:hypothetical protein
MDAFFIALRVSKKIGVADLMYENDFILYPNLRFRGSAELLRVF